jgi:hypothetical protein
MNRLTAERIVEVALQATDFATIDAEDDRLSAREVGLLNEQWIQSYVGDAISRYLRHMHGEEHAKPFVTYETTVAWLEHFFGETRGPGRIAGKLSDRQRFDITVWPANRAPVGLIEIKNEPIMSAYSRTADSQKLAGALRRWGTLRWGIFLFCVRNNTSKEGAVMKEHLHLMVQKTFDAIQGAVNGIARTSLKVSNKLHDDERQIMWAGAIIRRDY